MRPLFSARAFRISKISSCLRMPVAPGTSSCLAILVSAPTLMSLSVARSMRSSFSGAGAAPLPLGAAVGCAGWLRLFSQSVDQFPQFVQSFARDRRNRQHGMFKHGFEFSQRADPLAARELVDLGRHDGRRARPPPDPSPRPGVDRRLEARVPRVDQQERRRGAREHGADDRLELVRLAVAPPRDSRRRASAPARSRNPAGPPGTAARRRRARRDRCSRAASCPARRSCARHAGAPAR